MIKLLLAAEWRPDLILLGVKMPGMDEWEVCRRLRKAMSPPVIMLTAKTSSEAVIQGLRSGADDYIKKPFSLEELVLRIEAALRRTRRPAATLATPYHAPRLQIWKRPPTRRSISVRNGAWGIVSG